MGPGQEVFMLAALELELALALDMNLLMLGLKEVIRRLAANVTLTPSDFHFLFYFSFALWLGSGSSWCP